MANISSPCPSFICTYWVASHARTWIQNGRSSSHRYDKKPIYSIICTFRFIQYNLFNKCRYIHARRVKKRTPSKEKASQHILIKSVADVLDSLQTSSKSFSWEIFLNFLVSFISLFLRFFFTLSSTIHSLLNQNICSFSLVINGTEGKPVLNYNLKKKKNAVAKGATLTRSPQKKGEIQYVPVGFFTFLTLVVFLNKEPSAGWKCNKRFLKVAEEGG